MKIAPTYFALCLLFVGCGGVDSQKLTGVWNVEVRDADGVCSTKGTSTVAADGRFRSELATTVSNEVRKVTSEGTLRIDDGFLIETTTNVSPHWLPRSRWGTLPPGGVTSRTKIIRVSESEWITEKNEFGTVVYTKAAK